MMTFCLMFLSLVFIRPEWFLTYMSISIIFFFFTFFFPLSYSSSINLYFSNESFSFSMIYLSVYITLLMVSSSYTVYKNNMNSPVFGGLVSFLLLSLVLSFSVKSSLMFYFFFEVSLVPTLLLIMGWGYQIERVQASMYFLLYTMFSSLPLLLSVFLVMNKAGSFLICLPSLMSPFTLSVFESLNWIFMWFMMGAFLVKLPLYFVHLWLPKAHVEAPVSGSMILAGVLLKLGGYGVIRFCMVMKSIIKSGSNVLVSLSMVSMAFVGLICLRSNDLKSLVAYSSVSHMAMGLAGLLTMTYLGLSGGMMMLIGHGICSSGLFSLINMIYERVGSRSVYMGKGLMNLIVGISLFSFILSVVNMAAPPSMNLFSEVMLMISLIHYSNLCFMWLLVGSFLVAVYSMFFFSYTNQGKLYLNVYSFHHLSLVEYKTLNSHVVSLAFSYMLINLVL